MRSNNASITPDIGKTFETKPDVEPGRAPNRMLRRWNQCIGCERWYAAPNKELNRGRRIFCSISCCANHAAKTGKFAGANNPRWIGGVSTDNMRYRNRQKEREPVQEAARAAVYNAIKRGALVRLPCERCGATPSQGHHDDYAKPLVVRWLCRSCHDAHHAAEASP